MDIRIIIPCSRPGCRAYFVYPVPAESPWPSRFEVRKAAAEAGWDTTRRLCVPCQRGVPLLPPTPHVARGV